MEELTRKIDDDNVELITISTGRKTGFSKNRSFNFS